MAVSIVIPNWNGKNLLEKNLFSVLKAKNYKPNDILEIIIVDDASTDDSIQFLEKNYSKDIRLIKHTKNRGFAAAVNRGVSYARGKHVCLLNTDVIPSPKFLEKVIPHFRNRKVFAVGLHEMGYGASLGYFKDGFFQHGNMGELPHITRSMWASGGSAVFSKKIWRRLKGLDEALYSPFYWEDVDLGYRAHKRGYEILWEPSAHVVHKHESIINDSNFNRKRLIMIKERNYLLFNWKNITSRKLFNQHVLGLIDRIFKHPGYLKVVFASLKKYKEVRRLRRREIRYSKVSDEAIFAKFII